MMPTKSLRGIEFLLVNPGWTPNVDKAVEISSKLKLMVWLVGPGIGGTGGELGLGFARGLTVSIGGRGKTVVESELQHNLVLAGVSWWWKVI